MLFFNLFQLAILCWFAYYTSVLFFANRRLRKEMEDSREEFTQREALTGVGAKVTAEINNGGYDHYCNSFTSPVPRKKLIEFVENAIENKIKYGMNERHYYYESSWETNKIIRINVYCSPTGITRHAVLEISKVENYSEKENEGQPTP